MKRRPLLLAVTDNVPGQLLCERPNLYGFTQDADGTPRLEVVPTPGRPWSSMIADQHTARFGFVLDRQSVGRYQVAEGRQVAAITSPATPLPGTQTVRLRCTWFVVAPDATLIK